MKTRAIFAAAIVAFALTALPISAHAQLVRVPVGEVPLLYAPRRIAAVSGQTSSEGLVISVAGPEGGSQREAKAIVVLIDSDKKNDTTEKALLRERMSAPQHQGPQPISDDRAA